MVLLNWSTIIMTIECLLCNNFNILIILLEMSKAREHVLAFEK